MSNTFLGKPIPNAKTAAHLKPKGTALKNWLELLFLSLILGAAIVLNNTPIVGQTVFYQPIQQIRVLGVAPKAPVIKTADGTTIAKPVAPTPAKITTVQCDIAHDSALASKFNARTITPILPPEILTSDTCSPPYWNLDIIKIFIYKVMSILNYLIITSAIILTIYAGILYLSGFQSEGNIKKAKTVLAAVYTGLILSLSATLILRTTISIAADSNDQSAIQQNNSTIFNGDAPTQ